MQSLSQSTELLLATHSRRKNCHGGQRDIPERWKVDGIHNLKNVEQSHRIHLHLPHFCSSVHHCATIHDCFLMVDDICHDSANFRKLSRQEELLDLSFSDKIIRKKIYTDSQKQRTVSSEIAKESPVHRASEIIDVMP